MIVQTNERSISSTKRESFLYLSGNAFKRSRTGEHPAMITPDPKASCLMKLAREILRRRTGPESSDGFIAKLLFSEFTILYPAVIKILSACAPKTFGEL